MFLSNEVGEKIQNWVSYTQQCRNLVLSDFENQMVFSFYLSDIKFSIKSVHKGTMKWDYLFYMIFIFSNAASIFPNH